MSALLWIVVSAGSLCGYGMDTVFHIKKVILYTKGK